MGDARGIGGGCCSMDGRELRGVDNGVRLKELAWGKAGCGGEFSREPRGIDVKKALKFFHSRYNYSKWL